MPSLKTLSVATLLALQQASALKCEGSCLKAANKYDSPKMVSYLMKVIYIYSSYCLFVCLFVDSMVTWKRRRSAGRLRRKLV